MHYLQHLPMIWRDNLIASLSGRTIMKGFVCHFYWLSLPSLAPLVTLELARYRAYAFDMSVLQVIGLLAMLAAADFADPLYPPNAITGGTVVAELRISAGAVKQVALLAGEEPFASAAKTALAQWRFPAETDSVELVIVHFRQPNLYYIHSAQEDIGGAQSDRRLPYPQYIIGPAYPPQSVGQGSVILKATIADDGSVEKIDVIKPVGALTDVSREAVRKWKFLPAEDSRGIGKKSSCYAVLVFRVPVSRQKK